MEQNSERFDFGGPDCPEHGEQTVEWLVGNLEPDAARRVEAAASDCEICAAWWASTEDSESFRQVEMGVGSGLAAFTPPPRRSRPRLSELALAASIVALAVGIPMIASRHEPAVESTALELSTTQVSPSGQAAGADASEEVISSNGFEENGATHWRQAAD